MLSRSLQSHILRAARTGSLAPSHARLPASPPAARSALLPSAATHISRPFSASVSRAADAEPEPAAPKDEPKPAPAADDAAAKALEAKKQEVVDVTDKWKRSIADYRNLQSQTKREVAAARDFAIQKFARDLIDSVDNLDRALATVPPAALADGGDKDLRALHDGLRMTETILMGTLKRHGLERFDPAETGERFDPNKHEATFQVPQADKEDGTVFHTQSKGFVLNGRILRAAKVGVVKNS